MGLGVRGRVRVSHLLLVGPALAGRRAAHVPDHSVGYQVDVQQLRGRGQGLGVRVGVGVGVGAGVGVRG